MDYKDIKDPIERTKKIIADRLAVFLLDTRWDANPDLSKEEQYEDIRKRCRSVVLDIILTCHGSHIEFKQFKP